jgi:hypothetical protein
MDYGRPENNPGLDAYAEGVAQAAFKACKQVVYRDWAPLDMAEARLILRRRTPDEARLEWARKRIAAMGSARPSNLPEVYAHEQVYLHQDPERELKLQAIRIGDLGIAAIPNEVFALTGLKIKAQSPFAATFTIELANGSEGYIPPPEQHRLGGYTTWPARTAALEVEAETKITEKVLALLETVSGKTRRPPPACNSPYGHAVLALKPAAYYPLNEWSGARALDLSVNENHGVLEGGVALFLEGPAVMEPHTFFTNRAPHFAGGRLKATIPGIGENYTVELIFWNGLPNDARVITGHLFSRGPENAPGAPADHLALGGHGTYPGRLLVFNGSARNQVLAGRTEISSRSWNHVAFVREGGKVRVHLNGEKEPEIAGDLEAGFTQPAAQFFFAGSGSGFANLEGKLDDIAVFSRALKPEEIRAHFKALALQKL